ncbi:hypothetical protein [Paenibacillus gyeongsangnamensis]|uniref:hypothetical protein n=1 Tax=Paenibacillus gyeongsangnamensis TaxID=3388067 RepID=UPI002FD2AF3A
MESVCYSIFVSNFNKVLEAGIQFEDQVKGRDMQMYHIDLSKGMEFGIYTLGDNLPDPNTGKRISAQERIHEMLGANYFATRQQDILVKQSARRLENLGFTVTLSSPTAS